MRRLAFVIYLLFSLICCGPKQTDVERIIEDGVEVVINQLEPYKIKGELNSLTLETLYIMDFENTDFVDIGISDVAGFDVDSEGNIYIWNHESSEYLISKFDENGQYVSSFGHLGQGPGELEYPVFLRITENDNIVVSNNYGRMLVFLDSDGNFLKKTPQSLIDLYFTFLGNEKILTMKAYPINTNGMAECPIVICNTEFEEIAVIHKGSEVPNWSRAKKINGLRVGIWDIPPWSVSNGLIYLGNQDNGYEILVFDFKETFAEFPAACRAG